VVQLAEKTFEEKRNDVSLRDLLYFCRTTTIITRRGIQKKPLQ